MKIVILASGGGSNAMAIMQACKDPAYPAKVIAVISNVQPAGVLTKAMSMGVPTYVIESKSKSREKFEAELNARLILLNPDLIVMAGFMRMLSAEFVNEWLGKILNIHPGLTHLYPQVGGPGKHGHHVHETTLDLKVKVSGATVHFAIPQVDGGPAIIHSVVPVEESDNADTLAARILPTEHQIYPIAIKLLATGKVKFFAVKDEKAPGGTRYECWVNENTTSVLPLPVGGIPWELPQAA
ncbi:MAG: phosphoribosylglycinamide formyltransferase [Proteobacteria bacterium]|nr:phosphoribosylglycinamide formyltransferase [Pseudomonadota bacterium]